VAIVWKGALYDATTRQPIQGARIVNLSSNAEVTTNSKGHFDIVGNVGEKVSFHCPGYRPETHIILAGLEGIRLSFMMKMSSKELTEFVVKQSYKTQYQRDSAERNAEQSRVLARQSSSIGSPFSLLAEKISKKQRRLFHFKKQFHKMEQDQFIDNRYSPELVSSLTNLSGDTLAFFMNSYKMPYDYARAASALELKMWVRYNFKDFLKKTDSLSNLNLPY
jgi:hypothetical protein